MKIDGNFRNEPRSSLNETRNYLLSNIPISKALSCMSRARLSQRTASNMRSVPQHSPSLVVWNFGKFSIPSFSRWASAQRILLKLISIEARYQNKYDIFSPEDRLDISHSPKLHCIAQTTRQTKHPTSYVWLRCIVGFAGIRCWTLCGLPTALP